MVKTRAGGRHPNSGHCRKMGCPRRRMRSHRHSRMLSVFCGMNFLMWNINSVQDVRIPGLTHLCSSHILVIVTTKSNLQISKHLLSVQLKTKIQSNLFIFQRKASDLSDNTVLRGQARPGCPVSCRYTCLFQKRMGRG